MRMKSIKKTEKDFVDHLTRFVNLGILAIQLIQMLQHLFH